VLADDDVFFRKGGIIRMIELMKRANLALAQPSQSALGWWTDLFSLTRPFVRVRDTNCVEQGPLIIASAAFAEKMLPLPEVTDMAWGIEADWYRIKEGTYRIGIVDSCQVIHVGRVAMSYDTEPQMKAMRDRLSNSGVRSIWQLRTINHYWWMWQHSPSWRDD
jgi:hypothetical protein